MRKNTITDAEAQLLLSGLTPEGRPELAGLAASIAEVRRASFESAPQPSAALAAYLEQPSLGVSEGTAPTQLKGTKKMLASLSALGIAAKLAAATGVLALGLTGVGAAGALPRPAQEAFDGMVSTIVQSDETVDDGTVDDGTAEDCVVDDGTVDDGTVEDGTVDDGTVEDGTVEDGTGDTAGACVDESLPTGSKEFSEWVVKGAQDPDKVGSEFGARVSEQARELKDEKAEDRAENGTSGRPDGAGDPSGDIIEGDSAEEDSGKPKGTPGGRP